MVCVEGRKQRFFDLVDGEVDMKICLVLSGVVWFGLVCGYSINRTGSENALYSGTDADSSVDGDG